MSHLKLPIVRRLPNFRALDTIRMVLPGRPANAKSTNARNNRRKGRKVNRSFGKKKHNIQELVLHSIKKLMKNTGWTSRTIIKLIKAEYQKKDASLSGRVSR